MPYSITYARSAARTLKKLDASVARCLLTAIGELAGDPRPPGCKTLKNSGGALRIRVGDYRVVYDVHDSEVVILVLAVGHRRDVYRSSLQRR
ncbi:type II toxin-antitoxin system RelE family toxin [Brevibacterium luteolum]|uniref:Type II toxin-antitoxin system RelE/ParE family toxin n=1 Tax=Brevibacterium luteolum TaxID=199591 RepID=A0A849AP39_9MICO|nr:type II toxin-antitoxin system RelE/ParE family toxin [Brevibacterium luteolum]NNG78978.1 type II toxin-antitoxin system RelE/ParE family toxin [Brevibacterium luteolum]